MSKLLYIKANIKPEGNSRTFQISDSFVEEYRRLNPNDEVIVRDLYTENIDFLRAEDLGALFGAKNEESRNHPILKYAYEMAEADRIVIATPMWNLGVPAIVKAYFDYVSIGGVTFKYSENGPVGLAKATKALIVSGRGGNYSSGAAAEFEMGERYIRTILSFFGVKEVNSIAAENLDVVGMDVEKILADTITEAKEIAKNF